MTESITGKQLVEHLLHDDLGRVRFQMADGLPVFAVYIDADVEGGVMITLSDEPIAGCPIHAAASSRHG